MGKQSWEKKNLQGFCSTRAHTHALSLRGLFSFKAALYLTFCVMAARLIQREWPRALLCDRHTELHSSVQIDWKIKNKRVDVDI